MESLVVGVCAGLAAAGSSWAATVTLRAVQVNDTPITPTDHVTIQPGDLVVTEAFISGWEEDQPGSRLSTFQLTIDGLNGYWSGESGSLLPAGFELPGGVVPCESSSDCGLPAYWCYEDMGHCIIPCGGDSDCPLSHPNCIPEGNQCGGDNHDPEAFAFVDESRPDFVFSDLIPICAVRPHPLALTAGCAWLSGTPPFDIGERYAATFSFAASQDACGEFAIDFDIVNGYRIRSFLLTLPGHQLVPFATSQGITVEVSCPPPSFACCLGRGACENLSNRICDLRGGAWRAGFSCGDAALTCPRLILGPRPWEAN